MRRYIVNDVEVTGTPESPQTVSYADLTDADGNALPTTLTSVTVRIAWKSMDVPAYLSEAAGTTSFKIVRGYGIIGGTLTVGLEVVSEAAAPTPSEDGNVLTLAEMTAQMDIYIPDEFKRTYPPAVKTQWLNQAMFRLLRMLPIDYFQELNVADESVALGEDGEFALTSLTYGVRRRDKGIYAIRYSDTRYARKIAYDEYIELRNRDTVFNAIRPLWYPLGTSIYCLPVDDSLTVGVFYHRNPALMSLGATAAENVDCELDGDVHEVIVGLALEKVAALSEAAKNAYESAVAEVGRLASEYLPTETSLRHTLDVQETSDEDFPINVTFPTVE